MRSEFGRILVNQLIEWAEEHDDEMRNTFFQRDRSENFEVKSTQNRLLTEGFCTGPVFHCQPDEHWIQEAEKEELKKADNVAAEITWEKKLAEEAKLAEEKKLAEEMQSWKRCSRRRNTTARSRTGW